MYTLKDTLIARWWLSHWGQKCQHQLGSSSHVDGKGHCLGDIIETGSVEVWATFRVPPLRQTLSWGSHPLDPGSHYVANRLYLDDTSYIIISNPIYL